MPWGSTARKRVWEPSAMRDRSTRTAEAPFGTVTNIDRVRLRTASPDAATRYAGLPGSSATTTVTSTMRSTPEVAGSSTRSTAECAPVVLARARTATVVVSPCFSVTRSGASNVPSLPSQDSSVRLLPDPVRVISTP